MKASDCQKHISKNSHFDTDLSHRWLKLEFDVDIFHTKHLCEVTVQSVHKLSHCDLDLETQIYPRYYHTQYLCEPILKLIINEVTGAAIMFF